jgi:hypothetical protein
MFSTKIVILVYVSLILATYVTHRKNANNIPHRKNIHVYKSQRMRWAGYVSRL